MRREDHITSATARTFAALEAEYGEGGKRAGRTFTVAEMYALGRNLHPFFPVPDHLDSSLRCKVQRTRPRTENVGRGLWRFKVRVDARSATKGQQPPQPQETQMPKIRKGKVAQAQSAANPTTYTLDPAKAPKRKMVATSKMFVPAYHGMRDPWVNTNRVAALKAHLKAADNKFSLRLCKLLDVNIRADGSVAVIDGGGRLYMATELVTPKIGELECRVYEGLSEAEEIELYKAFLKQHTKGKPLDEWLAGRSQDPTVDEIMTTCERHGFEMTGSRGTPGKKNLTITHKTARLAHSLGALDLSLVRVLHSKWKDSRALTSEHIAAVAVLIGKLKANADRLTKAMDAFEAAGIQADAVDRAKDRGIKKGQGRHYAWMIAQLLIDKYNSGRMNGLAPLLHADLVFDVDADFKDAYDPHVPKPRH